MKEKEKTRSSTTEGVVTTTSRRQDHRLSCYTHTQTRSTVFRQETRSQTFMLHTHPNPLNCVSTCETLVAAVVWRVRKSDFVRRSRFLSCKVSCGCTQVTSSNDCVFLFTCVFMWHTPMKTWLTNRYDLPYSYKFKKCVGIPASKWFLELGTYSSAT
jgi:hypothetical protein